jgi:hypothetical protein
MKRGNISYSKINSAKLTLDFFPQLKKKKKKKMKISRRGYCKFVRDGYSLGNMFLDFEGSASSGWGVFGVKTTSIRFP